jgi:5-methylcytosine-specific restriction endonuclease McrA
MPDIDHVIRKQEIVKLFRQGIYQYFNHECVYCGAIADSLDHAKAKTDGGETVTSNLVPACRPCNQDKGSKELFEWYRTRSHWTIEREQAIARWLAGE